MRESKIKCDNCGREGGKFRFNPGKGAWYCVPSCAGVATPRDGTHKNWPLTTGHLMGPNHAPMVIENLGQLRRVENQCGVSSEVYNMDRSNRQE